MSGSPRVRSSFAPSARQAFCYCTRKWIGSEFDEPWSIKEPSIVLAVATIFVALMGELRVHSITEATESWGMREVFVGVIVVAIVGRAAILMALKNKTDISVTIAIGSSGQAAPVASAASGAPESLH